MSNIIIDPDGTTTLWCLTSTIEDSVKNENFDPLVSSTVGTTISALLDNPHLDIRMSSNYIDSLSDKELAMFVEQVEERENSFIEDNEIIYTKHI